jgi:DNA-binding MarR family transcriptional regulator
VGEQAGISTAQQAADNELVLAFGRLPGAASRLEYLLGRAIEEECGISHVMFEVLLILGRAGGPGLSMGAIAQEQVLTTGGVTRLVDRMEAAGLVERAGAPGDRRSRLARLTPLKLVYVFAAAPWSRITGTLYRTNIELRSLSWRYAAR